MEGTYAILLGVRQQTNAPAQEILLDAHVRQSFHTPKYSDQLFQRRQINVKFQTKHKFLEI